MLGHQSPVCEEAALSRIQQVIDTLEAERAEVRSVRRGLIGRSTSSKPTMAALQPSLRLGPCAARRRGVRALGVYCPQPSGDIQASIIQFLAKHPGSTTRDIAKALNLNPGSLSTRLPSSPRQARSKESRGYSVK